MLDETTPRRSSARPRRLTATIAAVLVVAAGLSVHALAPDGFVSDAAGDALYAALIYAVGVVVGPRLPSWSVAAIAFGWCAAVELFQLTGLPEAWGAAWRPLMLVFGTVFAPEDLLMYAVGAADLVTRTCWAGRAAR